MDAREHDRALFGMDALQYQLHRVRLSSSRLQRFLDMNTPPEITLKETALLARHAEKVHRLVRRLVKRGAYPVVRR